jgi:mono/diheme cytochrome c family protein
MAGTGAAELPPLAQVKVDFTRDIKPIFERSCLSCHGTQRPKGGLRLDSRESALKGGDSGKVILSGDSANSPLILIVAGLHDEIDRMPPKGKGDPLTPEEMGLLRAWIDQGAQWPETAFAPPQSIASAEPTMRWITLSGDEHKFREHFWMKEGFHAGLQNFYIQERPSPDSTLTLEGRLFPDERDIRLALRYDRANIGFIDVGFDQYRKYYDDSGGFYPFTQPFFSLDRDLELRTGRAWLDFGLTLPHAPKIALGYEYRFRQGTKATLQWGPIESTPLPQLPEPEDPFRRNIYPAFKEVDESVHILKLDASHEIEGLYLEDNFRAEFYDLETRRQNAVSMTDGQTAPSSFELLDEAHHEFRAMNTFRLEKEIRDWWFVSAGYLHSEADADASFHQTTVHSTGLPIAGSFWRTRAIILSQNSVLFNGNTRLGPWQNFTFSGGVQSEWMRQEGVGNVSLDTGNPAVFLTVVPATLDANLHKHLLQESARLQYTGLPFTSLFAEGRLEQEDFSTIESQIGGESFQRDTEADGDLADWRAGFYTSPHRLISLGAHYRNRDKETRYDHITNSTPGYPAFIRDRKINTDEIEAQLTFRPFSWLKTTLTYQSLDTDFDSATDTITNQTITATNVTRGGLRAGTFNANVYGLNLSLSPFSRWHFSGTFNYYDSRSTSADNGVDSVRPYRGDIYSVLASATYMLSTNTDLTASYTFSRANYAQNNFAAGLPLGIDYDWHVVQATIARRFKRASLNLQYAFYQYEEPTSGGFNDYTAHAVFATLNLHWP